MAYIAPTNSWIPAVILLCRCICKSVNHTTGTLKMMTSVMRFAMPVPNQPARGGAHLPPGRPGVHAAGNGLHWPR